MLRPWQDLFFTFPLNNSLHHIVHDLVVKVLNHESEQMEEYITQLFIQARFTARLIDAYRVNDAERYRVSSLLLSTHSILIGKLRGPRDTVTWDT